MKINVNELRDVAQLFAESRMFPDAASAAQCFVKILAGAEMGIPPFTSMNAFHIISGKVTLAANTIAARIKSSGRYDYRVKDKSSERCQIEFTDRGNLVHTETWDIGRARKAGVKNLDKFPDAMLFSRCISAGSRVACPDLIGSYYTPEELGADVNQDGEIVAQIGAPVEQPTPTPVAQIPAAPEWKAELIALGTRAKQAAVIMTPEEQQIVSAALDMAREVLKKNGNSTQEERDAATSALKQALGE